MVTVSVPVDKEGFLLELKDWTPEVAEELAVIDGISLSDAHWEIIHLLRKFYQTYDLSPAMRVLVKTIKRELGPEKASSIYLMTLFPESPAKIAARIAGLPKPDNCL